MKFLVAVCATIFGVGAFDLRAQHALPPPPDQPAISCDCATAVSEGAKLSPPDLAYLVSRAEAGDQYAAFRVSYHFDALEDRAEFLRWQRRAAELGSPVARYNMWFAHKNDASCEGKQEALRWLQLAAKDEGSAGAARSELPRYEAAVVYACTGVKTEPPVTLCDPDEEGRPE